jgi:hypothetical protein
MLLLLIFIFASIFYGSLSCPSGMIQGTSSNQCYQLIKTPASWLTAEYNCMNLGGHLATVDSAFVNTILNGAGQAEFTDPGSFWLGKTTQFLPGQWVWVDRSNATYSNWANGNILLDEF